MLFHIKDCRQPSGGISFAISGFYIFQNISGYDNVYFGFYSS